MFALFLFEFMLYFVLFSAYIWLFRHRLEHAEKLLSPVPIVGFIAGMLGIYFLIQFFSCLHYPYQIILIIMPYATLIRTSCKKGEKIYKGNIIFLLCMQLNWSSFLLERKRVTLTHQHHKECQLKLNAITTQRLLEEIMSFGSELCIFNCPVRHISGA